MASTKGVPKHIRLQQHILRKCAKYIPTTPTPSASSVLRPTEPPAVPKSNHDLPSSVGSSPASNVPAQSPAVPHSTRALPTSAAPALSDYAILRNAVKPNPVNCKKKTVKTNYNIYYTILFT